MLTLRKKSASTKKKMPVMVDVSSTPAAVAQAAAAPAVEITHEMIARRAYELCQLRGGDDPVRNWLDAEAELKAGQN